MNLLVSFSGGETSAYMAQWLNSNYKKYGYDNILSVFANTGLENEETLVFTDKCDKYFGLNLVWVEAKVNSEHNKGTKYTVTNFKNASRNGEPFEQVIDKYGIPNQAFPHCTRELKERPITAFGKNYYKDKYHTAIGIRMDEFDRINFNAKKKGYIYPLVDNSMIPTVKPMVNIFWRDMPFRLNLKGYQGNCATCWKKSDRKLYQIAKETPEKFEFMDKMETEHSLKAYTFFRKNRSAKQIIEESKKWFGKITDDSQQYTYQLGLEDNESCEVFSECK